MEAEAPVAVTSKSSHSLCSSAFSRGNESGVVIMLVAMLLVVFVGLTAFVVDGMRISSFKQESQNHAGLAAISALEEFVASPPGSKISRAVARANAVSGMNMMMHQVGSESLSSTSSNNAPYIEFGRWYFTDLTDGTQPCSVGGSSSSVPPCFVPSSGSEDVNAVRITGHFYKEIKNTFASVIGSPIFKAPVHAIASVIPTQGIALFDLSRSMVRETHDAMKDGSGNDIFRPSTNPPQPALHRYAYYLSALNGAGPEIPSDQDWSALQSNFPNRGSETDPTRHFASDYKRADGTFEDVSILKDSDFNGTYASHHPNPTLSSQYSSGAGGIYRIDRWGDIATGAAGYDGPEPYTTLLFALKETVTRLKNKRIAGSKFGIIFYDSKLSWSRTFNLTDDFDYLLKFLDPFDPDSKMLRYKHNIFPNVPANTNTPLALEEAARQLFDGDEAAIPASKFVMMMGDGLTNCMKCNGLLYPQLDTNGNGVLDYWDALFFNLCQVPQYTYDNTCNPPGSTYPMNAPYAPYCAQIRNLGVANACKFADLDGDGNIGLTSTGFTGPSAFKDLDDDRAFKNAQAMAASCANAVNSCQNTLGAYDTSMQYLHHIVLNDFVPSKTSIHVFPVGRSIRPISRDYADPNNPGKCLSQADIRIAEAKASNNMGSGLMRYDSFIVLPSGKQTNMSGYTCTISYDPYGYYTKPPTCNAASEDHFKNPSEDSPFLKVQYDLYRIVQMTGGVWAPIRPFQPNCVANECQPCLNCNTSNVNFSEFRSMDPLCENTKAQVNRYLDEIFGVNPYGLVIESVN